MNKNSDIRKEKISNNNTPEKYNQKLDAEIKEEIRKVEEYNAKLDAKLKEKVHKLCEGKSELTDEEYKKIDEWIREASSKRLYYYVKPNFDNGFLKSMAYHPPYTTKYIQNMNKKLKDENK